jgi:hypothetical protein
MDENEWPGAVMQRAAIFGILAVLLYLAWNERYKPWGEQGLFHENRYTGALCWKNEECWLP